MHAEDLDNLSQLRAYWKKAGLELLIITSCCIVTHSNIIQY